MARRKKFVRQPSKYENEAILVTSTVKKIELQNVEINEKLKTVFYCDSNTIPAGRLCIVWGRTALEVGDEFQAKGRLNTDGTFFNMVYAAFKKSCRY